LIAIKRLIPATLCALNLAAASSAQETDPRPVDQVLRLYEQGQFQEAELLGLRTLQESDSLAPVDRGLLYRTLGFTYVALGENEKAKNQFLAWLEIDPLAELDSVYISPKIITVFREAQAQFQIQSAAVNSGASPAAQNLGLQAARRSLLFPGLGQIYADRPTKGYVLLASEVVLLGAVGFCHFQYDEKHDEYLKERDPNEMQNLYDQYNLYYRARNAAIVLAAGVYLFSLYDALSLSPLQVQDNTLSVTFSPNPSRMAVVTLRL
jgi:hypothetical protein